MRWPLVGLGLAGLFSRGLAPVDLGGTPPEQRSAAACQTCHAAEHAEWSESRHAAAWTNGIFQREYQRGPLDWCVRCHAPLATGSASSVDAVAAEGVSCAVCHLRDGEVLAAARRPDSPHATRVVPEMRTEAFCEGCHQFNFPVVRGGQVTAYTDHPMQSTVAEFRAGPHAGRAGACLGCHGNTPAGHLLPGAHGAGPLEHALTMTTCRAGDELRVTLANVGAGHNVPTGDVHRHLLLRAWRSSAPELLQERFIGRVFVAADEGKQVRRDTSIPAGGASTFTFGLAALGPAPEPGKGEPVNVELRYVYTADELPEPRNSPGEPTWVTVHHVRLPPADLPRCPPS